MKQLDWLCTDTEIFLFHDYQTEKLNFVLFPEEKSYVSRCNVGGRVDFSLAFKKKVHICLYIYREGTGDGERSASLESGVAWDSLSRSWMIKAAIGSKTLPLFPSHSSQVRLSEPVLAKMKNLPPNM